MKLKAKTFYQHKSGEFMYCVKANKFGDTSIGSKELGEAIAKEQDYDNFTEIEPSEILKILKAFSSEVPLC